MRDLTAQIREYFTYVDEQQGAVDLDAVRDGADQPVQTLTPAIPVAARPRGWAVGLAAAAAIAAAVMVPLLLIALGEEPDVATTVPPTTEAPVPTTVVTTTVPEAASTTIPEVTTTTTIPVQAGELVLGGDGIGIASFGDDDETVIAAVTALLGEPWSDTGYHEFGFAEYCGVAESRTVRWGNLEGTEAGGGFFDLDFVRQAVRTVAGDMTGFVAYSASALEAAGDGSGPAVEAYPWLPSLEGLALFDSEQAAVDLYGDRLSEPTRDKDDGIPPIVVSRHLDLGGPWQGSLQFWDGRLTGIVSGPCPVLVGLNLDGNGIGLARFGDDPETVIAAVTRVLGPPDRDTGFVDPVEEQVIGACGPGRQRSVSWGYFDLGFVEQEVDGYAGFIAYANTAVDIIHGARTLLDDPWPLISLPQGVGLLDTPEDARQQFQEDLTAITNHPFYELERWAHLDLGGPWPVNLWFDEDNTDRITRITSTPCGE